MPAQDERRVFTHGDWQIDLGRRELRAHGVAVPIGGRAFEIIEILADTAGALVTKDEVMERVWPGVAIGDNTLQVHISALRKALGTDRALLLTVSGRGYRLMGQWVVRQDGPVADAAVDTVAVESARSPPAPPPLTNIPVAAFDLIGRAGAVQHLCDALTAYRAVTLTGPGGIGKTALALEVARHLFAAEPGDAWLIELASLSDPSLVPSAVAGVLGLKLGGEISAETVAHAIADRRLLLVMDNCEHIVDAAALLAETIVRMCAHVSILATSREDLRIEGEYIYRVPALDVPSPLQDVPDTVLEHSAVQLFLARLQAAASDFVPNEANLPVIAAICRRLDGIPLAIEFAAARAATLGLQQVAARLGDRFALLVGGRRTALPRHQTLRATLDWSYQLLPEPEQRLLRHLAIFAAGFTLEAATSVMQDAATAVVGIANLVGKSLVVRDGSSVVNRWRLLETIRAHALEKLAAAGEAEQAARRHATYLRDLFTSQAHRARSHPAVDDIASDAIEIDNVRAALDWCFSPSGDATVGIALTAVYVPTWLHLALLVECSERVKRALACLASDTDLSVRLQMQLQLALGLTLTYTMGSVDGARTALAKALDQAESLDDVEAQLQILWSMWVLHFNIGECRATQSITERFARAAGRSGDRSLVLIAERLRGYVLQHAGELHEAQSCFEYVLEHYVASTDRTYAVWSQLDQRVLARAMLARVLWLQGQVDQAIAQAQASLAEAQATNSELSICEALRLAMGPVTIMVGDAVTAEQSVALLIDIATSRNAIFWRSVGRCLEGKRLILRGVFAEGVALLRTETDACRQTGWAVWHPEFLGALAEGLAGLGRHADALVTVDDALAAAESGGERYYVAELLRIKGELLLETGEQPAAAAETCFRAARDVARQQGALFWELRVALSLARLRVTQGRRDDARRILAPVYGRFTEGFATTDLRAARAILESSPV